MSFNPDCSAEMQVPSLQTPATFPDNNCGSDGLGIISRRKTINLPAIFDSDNLYWPIGYQYYTGWRTFVEDGHRLVQYKDGEWKLDLSGEE